MFWIPSLAMSDPYIKSGLYEQKNMIRIHVILYVNELCNLLSIYI